MQLQSTSAHRSRGRGGVQLVLGVLVMLGLMMAGPATAQVVTTDTMAAQQQELSDAAIMDIFVTSNQAEVTTSKIIAGEETPVPGEAPPMEQPEPDTARMDVPQDTMYGGEARQDTTYAGERQQDRPFENRPYEEEQRPMGEAAMGANQQVQEFARRMIDEHSRLVEQAQQLSERIGVQPESNLVSQVMQNTVDGVTEDLRTASPDSLDQEYMMTQVVLHQQTLGMLEHSLIPNAENEELANLLETASQTVDQHLQQARDIFMQMGQEQLQPTE